MRIFDTVEDAEAALKRSLLMALSVGSLADARATVVSLLGEEYIGDYLLGETVSRVFVAVRRPHRLRPLTFAPVLAKIGHAWWAAFIM